MLARTDRHARSADRKVIRARQRSSRSMTLFKKKHMHLQSYIHTPQKYRNKISPKPKTRFYFLIISKIFRHVQSLSFAAIKTAMKMNFFETFFLINKKVRKIYRNAEVIGYVIIYTHPSKYFLTLL